MSKELKVLIVNDSYSSRMLLGEICEDEGFRFVMAKDGREAIAKMQTMPFDIVLMDIEMPVMNGYEATRYIKYQLPRPQSNTPVVAITAHNPKKSHLEFHRVRFDAIIAKPYTVQNVVDVLNSFCKKEYA